MASRLTPTETHELRVLILLDELYGKLHAISYNRVLDPSGTRYGTIEKMIEHYEHELVNGNGRSTEERHQEPADSSKRHESLDPSVGHVSPGIGRRHALARG
jgi:hypothetical protein